MNHYTNLISNLLHDNLITLLTASLIISSVWIIEWFRPAIKEQGVKSRLENIKIYALCVTGLPLITFFPLFFLSYLLPKNSLPESFTSVLDYKSFSGVVISIFIYAIVWDFFQYWLHRAEHHFPELWIFHRLHHNDKSMNSSTAIRQSLGSLLLAYFFVHIPTIIICGVHFLPYIGTIILFNGLGYLNHANIKLSLGKASYFISGPQVHRLHHGLHSDYHNCNFAAFFTFYDVIFGTFKKPKSNEWPDTGIFESSSSESMIDDVFLPWRKKTRLRK